MFENVVVVSKTHELSISYVRVHECAQQGLSYIHICSQRYSVASKEENRRKISSLNFFSYNWIFIPGILSTCEEK